MTTWWRGWMVRTMGVALVAVMALVARPSADEGMWTFANPPRALLKARYGFEPAQAWLDHLRLSSVRFNDGGSGSFVSARGLVLTNHHVASGQLQKASTAAKDYVKDGFFARTEADEMKCADLELNVLVSYEDVTARVMAAVKPGLTAKAALDARRAARAAIEKESLDTTGLRSEVVSLYAGGEYWLYRYKAYTDVRLVAAPEKQAAFFGGDPDNFTFPRYDLDFALLRAYENGKPASTPHHLTWNAKGAAEGELVFVSGHPGSTSRQSTVAQLELERDVLLPDVIARLNRQLKLLRAYSARGPEQARQAGDDIFGIENALKAIGGELAGLSNQTTMARKVEDERVFRARVNERPEWGQQYASAWDDIAAIVTVQRERARLAYQRYWRTGALFARARQIVMLVAEVRKPDGERLDGYHDSQLEERRLYLFSPAPIYPEFEEAILAEALAQSLEKLGPDDPYMKIALGGRSPAERARELVHGTKLGDPAVRKALVEGGEAAVAASPDPMIVLARAVDPLARKDIEWEREHIQAPLTAAGERLGQARFAVFGRSLYPDADFTLRLSYGAVKGYPMNGTKAPAHTTFYGLFDRAYSFGLKPPFDIPARIMDRRATLALSTPLNFVTTNDIIGGNSGSPVVNRQGELVGLVFDGNIESLVGNYVYDETVNRTVAVHSAAIIEALRVVYDMGALADELEGKRALAAR